VADNPPDTRAVAQLFACKKTVNSPLTVVLTNWKRRGGFLRVLDAVAGQRIRPQIFVWNNSPEPIGDRRITWQINSSRNCVCWPRWFMAAQAETPFVASIDDDLLPTDRRVLEDALAAFNRYSEWTVIGPFGRRLIDGTKFTQCPQLIPALADQTADFVKGRLMVMQTGALRAVLPARPQGPPRMVQCCDDIIVCSLMAGGRRAQHVIPASFRNCFRDLPEPHALSSRQGFRRLRKQAAMSYFDWRGP